MRSNESTSAADHSAAGVSLAQLTSAGVAIAWPEAVAIVQQICGSSAGSIASEFAPSLITIHASGAVGIDEPPRADPHRSVQSLGELLRTCLAGTDPPVPLRLVIAQASSTPPFYRSAAELSEALAFFETTSRSHCVRAVFERWRASRHPLPDSRHVEMRALVRRLQKQARGFAVAACVRLLAIARAGFRRAAAARAAIARIAIARPAWLTPRALATATVLFLCAGVAGLVSAGGLGRGVVSAVPRRIAVAYNRSATVWDRLVDGAAEAIRRPATRTSGQEEAASTRAPSAKRPSVRSRATRTAGVPAQRAQNAPTSAATASVPEPSVTAPTASDGAAPASLPDETSPPAASESLSPDPDRVYSAGDADVEPALPVDPNVASRPVAGFTAITITVDEAGRVLTATLADPPATVRAAFLATMNVSAVKTRRFHPALKGGRPVRYRTTIWVPER